jgi:hypothetical protein
MGASSFARSTTVQPRTKPPGTGELHQALEHARDSHILQAFCNDHGCPVSEVSTDGIHISMPLLLDLMRRRGYSVDAPVRPQTQLRKGHTTWLVNVTLPAGPCCALGFCTPNTS